MVDTKTLEDPSWTRKYIVKAGICLKAVHDYQMFMPNKEDDKDLRDKMYNGLKYLLKYAVVSPIITDSTFENDEFDSKELEEVYNILTIQYHLIPDISKDEIDQMQKMNDDQKAQFRTDIAMGRIDDLKKKHKLS